MPRSRAAGLGGARGRAMQGRGRAVAGALQRGRAGAAERGWQRWLPGMRAPPRPSKAGAGRVLGWGGFWAGGPFSIWPLPSAPERGTRQIFFKKSYFAECKPWALGKKINFLKLILPSASARHSAIFFYF